MLQGGSGNAGGVAIGADGTQYVLNAGATPELLSFGPKAQGDAAPSGAQPCQAHSRRLFRMLA